MDNRYLDGSGWETEAGYARAARLGGRIAVSGTTADGEDTYGQTVNALRRALDAVRALGGGVDTVVRTRMFLTPAADWQAAAHAHAELFGAVRPANTTLVVHSLIGDQFLVEVELDAEVAKP
ncbi:Rid family hydrolase [Actinoplanes sp. NPDC026619]|uniref:Rid family hydrolase n=1 Tax=Actinoplanes sp. NPDC026619 TaxID=3155798 RepID=UPI0033C99B05